MIKLDFDKYFLDKGISVRYNTLGNDETLVRSYVEEFQKDVHTSQKRKSEYVKYHCYSKLYNLEPRTKYTGFEKFKKIDSQFRKDIGRHITKPQYSSTGFVIDNKENRNNISYKEALLRSLKTTVNPILYLSGGIDSEVVGYALLEAKVKFTPVIFEWLDRLGKVQNTPELRHAYNFCSKNGLVPEIYQIDIESLWATDHFKKLAVELQISSPQLVTHAYMLEMLSVKYPNSTHLFGGEVRFNSNFVMDNGDLANLVFLNKVSPVGYNGVVYEDLTQDGFSAGLDLNYFGQTGEFQITSFNGNPQGSPISGLFTTTPQFQYQFRNPSVTVINNTPGGGFNSWTPTSASSTWVNVDSLGTSLCGVLATTSFGYTTIGVNFGLEVRSTTEPAIIVSSSITLYGTIDLNI